MNKEEQNVEVVEQAEQVTAEPEQQEVKPQDEKKYTDADVDAIIDRKFAKWIKEQEEKETEAKRLAKMTAEEKAKHELDQKAKRINELEAQLNRKDMEATATNLLSEKGLFVNSDVLDFVVRDDAEQTLKAINAFSTLVNDLADKKVSELTKGATPKKMGQSTRSAVTKEQFDKMNYRSKLDLKNTNQELYDQLTKG